MKTDTRSFYEQAVRAAVERIVATLDAALDLNELARAAALSPYHFHRTFRGMLGETPLELHRRLRLERAAWRLLHHDASVTEIAFTAGYETHESFTRAFRAYYQCSPSACRQSARDEQSGCRIFPIQLTAPSGIHFDPLGFAQLTLHLASGETIMDVTIEDRPALRVATVPHVGPYNRISEAFARLGAIAGPAGLFGPHAAMLAIYHDDPDTTPATELRSEAALVVSADAKLPTGVVERHLSAGPYAHATHVGPYEQLGDTWARLMGQWLPQSGFRVRDAVSYEVYRNTPDDTPNEKLITELYVPLEDARVNPTKISSTSGLTDA